MNQRAVRWMVMVMLGAAPGAARAVGGPAPGAVTAETVKLPPSPGSVRGLADDAAVSAFTGQVEYEVPIELPQGPGGLAPSLSLGYDGDLGNGPLGVGWSLSQAGIRRSLRLGVPAYDATDEIELVGLSGGQLVPLPGGGYRVEAQGNSFVAAAVAGGYELTDASGMVFRFGTAAGARKESGGRVAMWYLEQVRDVGGQTIDYRYQQDRGEVYLDAIEWGPTVAGARAYRVELVYEARPDPVVSFRTGFRVETARRVARLRIGSLGGIRRLVELTYDQGFALSRLHGVRVTSADGSASLPALTFSYAQAETGALAAVPDLGGWALNVQGTSLFDVDQDGAMDLLRVTTGGHSVRRNLGGRFAPAAAIPGAAGATLDKVRFLDMTGDSAAEMVWQQGSQWRVFQLVADAGASSWVASGSLGGATNLSLATVTITDVDGDYRMDVLSAAGSAMQTRMGGPAGLGSPSVRPAIDPARAFIQPGNPATSFPDINGDGLADVVYLATGAMYLYLGRGDGTFEKLHDVAYPWTGTVDASQVRLADLDRDGLLDVAAVRAGNVAWHRGVAGGTFAATPVELPRPAGTDGSVVVGVADANGNGSQDLVWSSDAGMWILDLAGPTTAGMLVAIDTGTGQAQRFSYQASTQLAFDAAAAGSAWTSTAPISMPVATRYRLVLASGGPDRSTRLDVRDIVYDRIERRFLGFLESTTSRPDPADGAPAAQIVRQVQRFAPGLGMDRAIRGQVTYERIEAGTGAVLRETFHDVAAVAVAGLPDEARLRRAITRSTEVHHLEGQSTPIVTRTEYEHDGEGRVTVERALGRLDLAGDETIKRRRYTDGASAQGVRDLVCEERLLTPDPGAPGGEALVSHGQVLYGDATSVAPLCQASAGRRRIASQYLASEARWIESEATTYNASGDPVHTRKGGVDRDLEYDAAGRVAAEVVHPTPTRALRWEMTWDDVLGLPTRVLDASGSAVVVAYDGVGRVASLGHEGAAPHVHNRYHHAGPRPYTETFTYDGPGDAVPALPAAWTPASRWRHQVAVHDGAGAPMFSATRLDVDRWLVGERIERDALGRAVARAEPYETTGSLEQLVASALPAGVAVRAAAYDALDRLVLQTLPTGATTTRAYRAFEATTVTEGLAPVTIATDGLDRVVRTTRVVDGVTEAVEASYDAAGRITAMRVPAAGGAALHRFEYDSLGRLVFATDPDIGDRALEYDDGGRLVTRTNGAGQTVAYAYDGAGRLISTVDDGGDEYLFHYDDALDPGAFGRTGGRLAWVEEPTGRVELGYDVLGQESHHRRTVGARAADRWTSRAASGLVLEVDHGGGFSLDLAYDPAGRVVRVGDLWQVEEQDASGRPLRERFGSGAAQTYERDDLGQPTRLRVLGAGGGALYDAGVTYGSYGQIEGVTDQDGVGLDHAASFAYDGGGRLTGATLGAAGPGQIRFAYQYDALQNMVRREAHGPVPLGILIGTYRHGEPASGGGPRGPRQLTSILPDPAAGSPAGAPTVTLDYDGAGRVTRRGDALLVHDGQDRLVQVSGLGAGSGQVVHDYGYDGLRVRTVGPSGAGTTWFSPEVSETDDGVRRIEVRIGDRLIAQVTRDPAAISAAAGVVTAAEGARAARALLAALAIAGLALLVAMALSAARDPRRRRVHGAIGAVTALVLLVTGCGATTTVSELAQGATTEVLYYHAAIGAGPTLVTGADGALVDERRHEPFGATIDAATADPHDVFNKLTDPATGWSDHGARWMAPEIARWTAPDPPVKAPDPTFMTAPWKLNPYQYVDQNPVLYWDPDGEQPAGKPAAKPVTGCWPNEMFPRETPPLPKNPLKEIGSWVGHKYALSREAAEILGPILRRLDDEFDVEDVVFRFGPTGGADAWTLRYMVTIDPDAWANSNELERLELLTHEIVHSLQYTHMGLFKVNNFLIRYYGEYGSPGNYRPPEALLETDLFDLDPVDDRYTLDQIAERVAKEVHDLYVNPNCPYKMEVVPSPNGGPPSLKRVAK